MKRAVAYTMVALQLGTLVSAEADPLHSDVGLLRKTTDQCTELLSKGQISEGFADLFKP